MKTFALAVFENHCCLYIVEKGKESELIYSGNYDTCKFLINGRDYVQYIGGNG